MPKEYALRLMQETGAVLSGENHAAYDCSGLHIHMQYDEGNDTLLLYVHLGFLPQHPAPHICESLLELNFLGAELGGGHVGLHGRSRALVYSLRLEVAQQSAQSLQNALHLFASHTLELLGMQHEGRKTASAQEQNAQRSEAQGSAGMPAPPASASAPTPASAPSASLSGKGVVWG